MLFDATERVLFASDLLPQRGNPALVADDVLANAIADFEAGQRGPFHDSIPWTPHTATGLERLRHLNRASSP